MTAIELRILLKGLILPPTGPLLLGIAGLFLWRRRPRLALVLCSVSIGSLWLLATPIISDALSRATEGYPALDPANLTARQAGAQAIVILGGGYRRDAPEAGGDAPNGTVALRLVEAAKIARASHLPILVSGTVRETNSMRRFAQETLQIPVRWVESASGDTHENAIFSARLLRKEGIEHIILVTSSAHMVRAAAEFSAAGLDVTAAPAEMWTKDDRGFMTFVPSMLALDRSRTVLYEWAGRITSGLLWSGGG